jgi:hypothetical protein
MPRDPLLIYFFIHFAHFCLQNTYTNAVSHYPPIEPGMSYLNIIILAPSGAGGHFIKDV